MTFSKMAAVTACLGVTGIQDSTLVMKKQVRKHECRLKGEQISRKRAVNSWRDWQVVGEMVRGVEGKRNRKAAGEKRENFMNKGEAQPW